MPELTRANALAIVGAYEGRAAAAETTPGMTGAEAFGLRAAALGLEDPGFDWQRWEPFLTGQAADPAFVAEADARTLQRIMTTHLRANRFTAGHLQQMEDQGVLAAVAARLAALVEADAI